MSDDQESVSANEAARELNLSSRSFRRLAAAGKIPSFKTPSGYVRVRRRDLDAYIQSLSPSNLPSVPSRADSIRDEVQVTLQELNLRRARRDLKKLEEEERQEAQQKEAARRAQEDEARREQRERAAESARQEHERAERERQEQELFDRQIWVDEWTEFGLRLVPPDIAGRFASEIQLSIEEVLQGVSPGRPRSLVERLVRGAVEQAVRPWIREQDVAKAASEAANLPELLGYPERRVLAQEQAVKAILALPESAGSYQMAAIGRAAAQRVAQEQEQERDRRRREAEADRARASREAQADMYLFRVSPYLEKLERAADGVDFEGERLEYCERIVRAIKPKLASECPLDFDAGCRRVEELVDEWLEQQIPR